jgi:hypothetical protein
MSFYLDRIMFYYRHRRFIDLCIGELKARGFHEVDAERLCYNLAYRLGERP